MKEPSVAIILSNYKGASIKYRNKPILYRCLSTVYGRTRYRNYKVIVADDDSGDGSREMTRRVAPKAIFLLNKNCHSFAKNNNRAIEYVLKRYAPDYFLLLNYDTIVSDANWLADIVKIAESDVNIGAVSPNLLYPNGKNQGFGFRFYDRFSLRNLGKPDVSAEEFSKVRDAVILPGVALLVRSSVAGRIGLLDENYIGGYEDVDYCLRIRDAGMRNVYDGKAEIIHLQGYMRRASSSPEYRQKIAYADRRNQFYFLRKHIRKAGYARFIAWHIVYFADSIRNGNFRVALKALMESRRLKLPQDQ